MVITTITSVVLYIVALCYLRATTRDDPGSIFYDSQHGQDYKYTRHRRLEVAKYLVQQSPTNATRKSTRPSTVVPGSNTTTCLAVMSAKRSGRQYIDEAIGSILFNLTLAERSSLWINLHLARTDLGDNLPATSSLVDATSDYESLDVVTRSQLQAWEESTDLSAQVQKANFDYVAALDACITTGLPWIVILEDDVIMADGWLSQLEHALATLAKPNTRPWAYIRLFYADRFQNWRADDTDHYIVWCTGTFIIVYLAIYLCFNGFKINRTTRVNAQLVLLAMLVSSCAISLIFLGGRSSMLPRPSLQKMNEGGCCAQGLVYSRDRAIDLIHFLKTGPRDLFADSMIEAWANQNRLDRWAITPPVLQHVGTRTTKMRADEDLSESEKVATGSARLRNFQFEQYMST